MNQKQKIIAVIGGSQCTPEDYSRGVEVGKRLAENGIMVICGGLFGIMEAACKGAYEAGGITIGILPGSDPTESNEYVAIPIATGMGIGRNIIIVRSADACIAIDGKYGTLSEIAYALQLQKPVITLNSWEQIPETIQAKTAKGAVELALSKI
jgi:uncharacterized protein (TIGR00725 family)